VPATQPAAVSSSAGELADTAALLRELSSLGFDDDDRREPAPSRPVAPPRPAQAAPEKKAKRRGFFGLG
jgi:hypothetical protein